VNTLILQKIYLIIYDAHNFLDPSMNIRSNLMKI